MKRRKHLALVALLPALLLSGCGFLGGSATTGSGDASGTQGDPDAPSWIVSANGRATVSPAPTFPAAAPTPASGFLPLPARVGGPARTPGPTCSPNTFNFSRITGLDVTPAATSAVLTWYNVGGYNLVEFRLYAISQDLVVGDQRDVGYTTVKPTTPCGRMSATVPNLDPKTGYVFSVDAVVVRKSGDGTYSATVARSHPIRTT